MLILCTVLHFSVDGVCGAVLAEYAVHEEIFSRVVYYFGLYSLIAFGFQWLTGLILDRRKDFLIYALILAPVFLASGMISGLGIFWQAVLLGIGNCFFHVSAGILILERYNHFREPGIFVSSGALGLALGLQEYVSAFTFEIICAVFTFIAVIYALKYPAESDSESHNASESVNMACLIAGALMLLLCVILRGFGGSSHVPEYILLMPCVFVLGKSFGGILCDALGWRKTILAIFILSFLALQIPGITGTVILTFAFNMTMPLTLRLLHIYFPEFPGLTFGLAAGCLLPGAFYGKYFSIPAEIMILIQFLGLFVAGFIFIRYGKDGRFSFTRQY